LDFLLGLEPVTVFCAEVDAELLVFAHCVGGEEFQLEVFLNEDFDVGQ
jgi:hypothetical protein